MSTPTTPNSTPTSPVYLNKGPWVRSLKVHRNGDEDIKPSPGIHRVMSTSALRIPKQRNSFWQR